jgi:cell division protein FtsB
VSDRTSHDDWVGKQGDVELSLRLRASADQCRAQHQEIAELKEQIKTLRAERDLLRREVCRHRAAAIQDARPEDIAAMLQWDCFKDQPNG